MRSCNCHLCHPCNIPSSNGNFVSSISHPKIFGYLIPILIAVVGANVQGTTKPLIETHTASLCSFLVATIFYCIALAADYKANCSQFWGVIAIIFGSLSAFSLLSIVVPRLVGDIILYTAWIFAGIIIVVLLYSHFGKVFMNACRWLYHQILKPFFCKIFNRFRANNNISSTEQQQRPPV